MAGSVVTLRGRHYTQTQSTKSRYSLWPLVIQVPHKDMTCQPNRQQCALLTLSLCLQHHLEVSWSQHPKEKPFIQGPISPGSRPLPLVELDGLAACHSPHPLTVSRLTSSPCESRIRPLLHPHQRGTEGEKSSPRELNLSASLGLLA